MILWKKNKDDLQNEIASLDKQANHLYENGRYEDAIDIVIHICNIIRQNFGENHPDYAGGLNNLALLYKKTLDYTKAEQLFQQASEIFRQVLGENHPNYANSLNNLAMLYYDTGNYTKAEQVGQYESEIWRRALGENHPNYANSLNNLAMLYYKMNDYTKAEQLFQQASEIWRRALGENHPDYAVSLHNSAGMYRDMGSYLKAEQLYQQALDIRRRVLGENHPDYAMNLNNLAALYDDMGHYSKAEQLYQQASEIFRQVLGENHPDYAMNLNNLAMVYNDTGNYTKAEQLYQQASEIFRQVLGENHPNYAMNLNNLAALYDDMGHYSKAEQLYQQALDIRRRVLGENHPDYARNLNNLAALYYDTGNYTKAEQLYQQASEIFRQVLGENHPDYARNLNNLAALYYDMGHYSKAEQLFQQASEIFRQVLGENHPNYARNLTSLAVMYSTISDYTKAEQLVRQALDIWRRVLGENHPDYAMNLNNLAALYYYMGHYSKAEQLYQQASEIWRRVLGENHPDYATNLNNLAMIYNDMGNYTKADQLVRQALDIRRRVLGENHPDYAGSLNSLALLYHDMGNYTKAEQLVRQASEIFRQVLGENHPDYAGSLSHLATLYIANGRQVEGMKILKLAAGVDDVIIRQIFSIGSERQRMMFLYSIGGHTYASLSLLVQYFSSSLEAVNSMLDLVLRRKAIGAEALAAQRDAVLSGKYPELESKIRELKTLRIQIGQKTLKGPSYGESFMAYQKYIEELNAQRERVEVYLAHKIPEIRIEQKLQTANRQSIANALSEEEALIEFIRFDVFNFLAIPANGEYIWNPAHYIAFILLGGEPDDVQMIDLGEAEPIDRMIMAFRMSILDKASHRHFLPISDESKEDIISKRSIGEEFTSLRATLFDPLIATLKDRKRLFLAPDGDLSTFPFEVLPMDKDGRYLIDEYFISYLNTGRDILRFVSIAKELSSDPLIAADPDFDLSNSNIVNPSIHKTYVSQNRYSHELYQSTSIHFAQLQGTRVEGEQIAKLLHIYPWLGGKVLETHVKSCRSPRILHIATHGFFLPDQPNNLPNKDSLIFGINNATATTRGMIGEDMINRLSGGWLENPLLRSGLALAGANTWLQRRPLPRDAEDGILTAEDVTTMDLTNTELVVLSACETGLGEVHYGEGVFGLRRAFVLAGAQTLVMSLWRVPDEQTKDLMIDFYNRVLAGQAKAEALREARLAIKKKYPDNPYYWGAFVCQGNPGPLRLNQNKSSE